MRSSKNFGMLKNLHFKLSWVSSVYESSFHGWCFFFFPLLQDGFCFACLWNNPGWTMDFEFPLQFVWFLLNVLVYSCYLLIYIRRHNLCLTVTNINLIFINGFMCNFGRNIPCSECMLPPSHKLVGSISCGSHQLWERRNIHPK